MKKNNRQLENESFFGVEVSHEFFDFDVRRSKSKRHLNRFSEANKNILKNLKSEKIKGNES